MRLRTALVALTALAVGSASACGGEDQAEPAEGEDHTLVSYSREGGIRFQSIALTVSMDGEATVRSEGCTVRFSLQADLRRRLGQALEGADLAALADDYRPSAGAADLISERIVVGGDAIRIGDFASLPARVQRELEPLVAALGEVLADGELRRRASCE